MSAPAPSSPPTPNTHGLLYLKPASWHWGRCLRAALCVGMPFACGIALHDIMPWMWVAMGTLMMTTGERPIPYAQRIPCLLAASMLGATGYLLGYLSHLPYVFTLVVMAGVAFIAHTLSRRGPNWSIGCLQLLLTASIAIGVPSIGNFWWPALWYLLGALIYALVLGIEALAVYFWPQATHASVARPSPAAAAHSPATAWPALALIACLTAAYAAKYVIHANHWFWIPLTVGLIMKPDLGNVFDRSIQRCIGAAVGVLIASIILSLFPKDLWMAAFIALLAGVLPWCMARSYVLQAVVLTPLVLLLVDTIMPGSSNENYSIQRLLDTILGATIVLLIGGSFWYWKVRKSS